MRIVDRDSQVTIWMKVGFFGMLGVVAGVAMNFLGFRTVAAPVMWIGWVVGAVGLIGHRIVRLRKR